MKFFYQLKINIEGEWKEIFSDIEKAESKKELIDKLKTDHGVDICKKITGSRNSDYKIFAIELTDYWEKHWLSVRVCKVCSKEYTLLQSKQNNQYSNYDCCSSECNDVLRKGEYFNHSLIREEKNSIYRIYNKINKKSFISKSRDVFFKLDKHFNNPGDSDLHKDIKKYSLCDWSFEVLETLDKNLDIKSLNDRLNYWVERYDSIKNGYNKKKSYY